MTNKQRKEMYAAIERHGNELNRIFKTSLDNVSLCKKLRRLELAASRICEKDCNGEIDNEIAANELFKIRKTVVGVLKPAMKNLEKAIFINRDPRGYALKIEDEYVRENDLEIYRDMGEYGILAPDFSKG